MRAWVALLVGSAVLGVAYALRARLVDVLTKLTGTWVGSPPAPTGTAER